ncbi:hypothetical protein PS623_04364 [Pseudomonas fluorescens]|nr:hypothetical protein PS623_04364 [Pseudomonas fluorescens]
MQPRRMAWPAVQVQLVKGDHADLGTLRQLCQTVAVAEQQARATVGEHERQPLGRVIDVQRHIGATGLEDRQQADQQLWRALQGNRDTGIGADTFVAQVMRQAVGLLVQAGVIEAAAVPEQSRLLRGQARLFVELLDQQALRRRRCALAPLQQLRARGGIKQLHIAQRQLRLRADLFEQGQQVLRQAPHGGRVEQLGGIVEG